MRIKNVSRITYHVSRGFTLIELLVVIGIIGMLVAIAIPNFLSARQRASDVKKKQEMVELKNALRLYYNDFNTYPPTFNGGIGKLNYIAGCQSTGTAQCPCNAAVDFGTGTNCDNIYMKKFPSDFGTGTYYFPRADIDDYCLVTTLDNKSDPDIQTSQLRCSSACIGISGTTNCSGSGKYCVCSD